MPVIYMIPAAFILKLVPYDLTRIPVWIDWNILKMDDIHCPNHFGDPTFKDQISD